MNPAEIAKERIRAGLCPQCGTRLFELKPVTRKKSRGPSMLLRRRHGSNSTTGADLEMQRVPLDIEGEVYGGQCLRCVSGASAPVVPVAPAPVAASSPMTQASQEAAAVAMREDLGGVEANAAAGDEATLRQLMAEQEIVLRLAKNTREQAALTGDISTTTATTEMSGSVASPSTADVEDEKSPGERTFSPPPPTLEEVAKTEFVDPAAPAPQRAPVRDDAVESLHFEPPPPPTAEQVHGTTYVTLDGSTAHPSPLSPKRSAPVSVDDWIGADSFDSGNGDDAHEQTVPIPKPEEEDFNGAAIKEAESCEKSPSASADPSLERNNHVAMSDQPAPQIVNGEASSILVDERNTIATQATEGNEVRTNKHTAEEANEIIEDDNKRDDDAKKETEDVVKEQLKEETEDTLEEQTIEAIEEVTEGTTKIKEGQMGNVDKRCLESPLDKEVEEVREEKSNDDITLPPANGATNVGEETIKVVEKLDDDAEERDESKTEVYVNAASDELNVEISGVSPMGSRLSNTDENHSASVPSLPSSTVEAASSRSPSSDDLVFGDPKTFGLASGLENESPMSDEILPTVKDRAKAVEGWTRSTAAAAAFSATSHRSIEVGDTTPAHTDPKQFVFPTPEHVDDNVSDKCEDEEEHDLRDSGTVLDVEDQEDMSAAQAEKTPEKDGTVLEENTCDIDHDEKDDSSPNTTPGCDASETGGNTVESVQDSSDGLEAEFNSSLNRQDDQMEQGEANKGTGSEMDEEIKESEEMEPLHINTEDSSESGKFAFSPESPSVCYNGEISSNGTEAKYIASIDADGNVGSTLQTQENRGEAEAFVEDDEIDEIRPSGSQPVDLDDIDADDGDIEDELDDLEAAFAAARGESSVLEQEESDPTEGLYQKKETKVDYRPDESLSYSIDSTREHAEVRRSLPDMDDIYDPEDEEDIDFSSDALAFVQGNSDSSPPPPPPPPPPQDSPNLDETEDLDYSDEGSKESSEAPNGEQTIKSGGPYADTPPPPKNSKELASSAFTQKSKNLYPKGDSPRDDATSTTGSSTIYGDSVASGSQSRPFSRKDVHGLSGKPPIVEMRGQSSDLISGDGMHPGSREGEMPLSPKRWGVSVRGFKKEKNHLPQQKVSLAESGDANNEDEHKSAVLGDETASKDKSPKIENLDRGQNPDSATGNLSQKESTNDAVNIDSGLGSEPQESFVASGRGEVDEENALASMGVTERTYPESQQFPPSKEGGSVNDTLSMDAASVGTEKDSTTGKNSSVGSASGKKKPHARFKAQERIGSDGDPFEKCKYDGSFNDEGERHGFGVMTWSNGDVYEGQFWHGMIHGEGTITYNDGSEYEGWWKLNKMHGFGTRRYANGDVYTGNYVNGKRHGSAQCNFANGDVYHGPWKDDKMHGVGKYYYRTKETFEGKFRKGIREGTGMYTFSDGKVDIIRYSGDKRTGEGVRWAPNRKKAWKLEKDNLKSRLSVANAKKLEEELKHSVRSKD